MFQIVYVSAAVDPMDDDDLAFLLRQARENNDTLGLTGMLLYKNQRFMQALEGERNAVETIYYDHICHDNRHEGVVQLMGREIEDRDFSDWTMGFRTEGGSTPSMSAPSRLLWTRSSRLRTSPITSARLTRCCWTSATSRPRTRRKKPSTSASRPSTARRKRVDEAQRRLDERQQAFEEREAGQEAERR